VAAQKEGTFCFQELERAILLNRLTFSLIHPFCCLGYSGL